MGGDGGKGLWLLQSGQRGVARRSCGSPHGAALGVPVRRAGGLGAGAQWGGRARTQGCWCSGLDVIHGAVAASVSCLFARLLGAQNT